MTSRRLLVAALLMTLTDCPGCDEECRTSDDCNSDEACYKGACARLCNAHDDCLPGTLCRYGLCQPVAGATDAHLRDPAPPDFGSRDGTDAGRDVSSDRAQRDVQPGDSAVVRDAIRDVPASPPDIVLEDLYHPQPDHHLEDAIVDIIIEHATDRVADHTAVDHTLDTGSAPDAATGDTALARDAVVERLSGCERTDQCDAGAHCNLDGHVCVCDPGFHACGVDCLPDDSTLSCGTRCDPCPADPNGTATCDGASCVITCNPEFVWDGSACVPRFSWTECVSLDNRSCGEVCTALELSCASVCITSRGYPNWAAEAWSSESHCLSSGTAGGQKHCDFYSNTGDTERRWRCCCGLP